MNARRRGLGVDRCSQPGRTRWPSSTARGRPASTLSKPILISRCPAQAVAGHTPASHAPAGSTIPIGLPLLIVVGYYLGEDAPAFEPTEEDGDDLAEPGAAPCAAPLSAPGGSVAEGNDSYPLACGASHPTRDTAGRHPRASPPSHRAGDEPHRSPRLSVARSPVPGRIDLPGPYASAIGLPSAIRPCHALVHCEIIII